MADLKDVGLNCPIVGGAGTGTFALEAASGVYTELQVGSYVFMDADYARNEQAPPFAQSLFVLTTVMSAPRRDLAVVDAGLKALAFDSGPPVVWNRPGVTYAGASDEHGKLVIAGGAEPPRLGEKLRLQPGHCDPTVDRYDWYVGCRGDRVECLWPVARPRHAGLKGSKSFGAFPTHAISPVAKSLGGACVHCAASSGAPSRRAPTGCASP